MSEVLYRVSNVKLGFTQFSLFFAVIFQFACRQKPRISQHDYA